MLNREEIKEGLCLCERITDMIDEKMENSDPSYYATNRYAVLAKISLILSAKWLLAHTDVFNGKNPVFTKLDTLEENQELEENIWQNLIDLSQDMNNYLDMVMDSLSWKFSLFEDIEERAQEKSPEEFKKELMEETFAGSFPPEIFSGALEDIYGQTLTDEGYVNSLVILVNEKIPGFMEVYRSHKEAFSNEEGELLSRFRDLTDYTFCPFYILCRNGLVNGLVGNCMVTSFLAFEYSPTEEVIGEFLLRPQQVLKAYLLDQVMLKMEEEHPSLFQKQTEAA